LIYWGYDTVDEEAQQEGRFFLLKNASIKTWIGNKKSPSVEYSTKAFSMYDHFPDLKKTVIRPFFQFLF
jgi:hypothetical protein